MGQVLTHLINCCLFHPCLVLAGILALSIVLFIQPERPQVEFDRSRIVKLSGEVDTSPIKLDRSLYLEMSVLSIHQGERKIDYPGRVAVYIYSNEDSEKYFTPPLSYAMLYCGDSLRLQVYLEEPPPLRDSRRPGLSAALLAERHLALGPNQVPIGRFSGRSQRPSGLRRGVSFGTEADSKGSVETGLNPLPRSSFSISCSVSIDYLGKPKRRN